MTIHATAIAVYGRENQIRKTLEELAELSLELHRALDGRGDNEHIREEMADVMITLSQMELVYGKVDYLKQTKLDMLATRLGMKIHKTLYDLIVAPELAKWAARDKNGDAFWYETEPKYFQDGYFDKEKHEYKSDKMLKLSIIDTSCDWSDSREMRPE